MRHDRRADSARSSGRPEPPQPQQPTWVDQPGRPWDSEYCSPSWPGFQRRRTCESRGFHDDQNVSTTEAANRTRLTASPTIRTGRRFAAIAIPPAAMPMLRTTYAGVENQAASPAVLTIRHSAASPATVQIPNAARHAFGLREYSRSIRGSKESRYALSGAFSSAAMAWSCSTGVTA